MFLIFFLFPMLCYYVVVISNIFHKFNLAHEISYFSAILIADKNSHISRTGESAVVMAKLLGKYWMELCCYI